MSHIRPANNSLLDLFDKDSTKSICHDMSPADVSRASNRRLRTVDELNRDCENNWAPRMCVDDNLTRPLVSFQANKKRAVYRLFKYKEAFSAQLVEYLLSKCGISSGILLDPFAGSGTALFTASALGIETEGIELLAIGQEIIRARQIIEWDITPGDVSRLKYWRDKMPWHRTNSGKSINELKITRGAYPVETITKMGQFLAAVEQEQERIKILLRFALLCVLESISFTRKDGQYLRWDHRSGRRQGKTTFEKGKIMAFDKAICDKLHEIVSDLRESDKTANLFAEPQTKGKVILRSGSCLEVLPMLDDDHYDCLITSPPYCNRYDYTRTYALELALLDIDEAGLRNLRQNMLSCTVENRDKDLMSINSRWKRAITSVNNQELLQSILLYLDEQKQLNLLNNKGIPRMLRGYFYEMGCVIHECARVLKSGAPLIMVNDNVRYAGVSIPVDIILSTIAEELGFYCEHILVLLNGKGNSSQQMGKHGRDPLRKCVYIWRKV